MRRPVLLSIFFALFIATINARANIYGLTAMAENPSLNAMQGAALMMVGYEEAYWYNIYLRSFMYEGAVLRSSGDAFGADGYPLINGYVAMGNTQNTLDFDNPDPHILYGDFYLGPYFYKTDPTGSTQWYDPMGYSFFGSDYRPEYTFVPCRCGGYQKYQTIYLGSLGLLFEKPKFEIILSPIREDQANPPTPDKAPGQHGKNTPQKKKRMPRQKSN